MTWYLKQSTASQEVLLGPFVDSTDGNTAETGLTIANTDIKIFKAGATTLASKNSGGGTHISNGNYYAVLDATDTDTVGSGTIVVQVSGALAVRHDFIVLPANVYDSLMGTDLLQVDVSQFGNSNATTASGIPSVVLTTSGVDAVADQVWDEAASGHVTAGSYGQAWNIIRANTAQAGGNTTITLDASASAVDDFYNNARIFITAGTGVGQGRFISDYVGSTKVATVATWATNPSSDSVFVIIPFGSIPGASAPTAGEVADAVWDELRSDHVGSGSFGEYMALCLRANTAQAGTSSTITLDASASATNDLYKYNQISIVSGTGAGQSRQVTAYVGSSKVATVGVNWTTNPSSDSKFIITPLGVDAATVAAIADAVWDEARSGHATAGTFGEYVFADTVRISGDSTSADNLESYTDGTTPMPVDVSAISGDTTAADNAEAFFDGTGYAGTNNIIPSVTTVTGNVTGNVGGSVGSVTGNVGGNVTGSVGSLAAQAKADVNAEVVDGLATDTYAEPGQGAPAATAALSTKISYVYKALRNKHTQTATTFSLYADDASTVDQKATVSDDGTTFTRGEIAAGP